MKRWERLEEWILDNNIETFTSHDLARSLQVTKARASEMIQAHLYAQRSAKVGDDLLYVLKRSDRTSNAVWSVGVRVADAKAIETTYYADIKRKWERAVAPDLQRLAAKNPRAARHVQATLDAVIEGAFRIMAAALSVDDSDEG